jgi:CDP-4-dehydro-6-deoxyglucose reductase, E1
LSETNITEASTLREQILKLARQYHGAKWPARDFVPGQTVIPAAGKVFGPEELANLVDSSLDFWLTTGRFNEEFEKRLAKFLNINFVLTVNSGSSANLVAFAALTSHLLEERALRPGDEMITVAAGFPTTVNPAVLYGITPVFVDVEIPTYNVKVEQIEAAITPRTRAIMLAHTLGNPFNLDEVLRIARKHHLWLIEDTCDALGATYDPATEMPNHRGGPRMAGTFGDIGTLSFYPAHHITMGEGGAVFTNNPVLKRAMESIRDWGRDCWCAPGKDNTCGKRFDWQLGGLPFGYDHKFTYSHLGYNLKLTDMQAAVGLAQLDRLPEFVELRRHNFAYLAERLSEVRDVLILPQATPRSVPSWFGFPLTLRPESGIERHMLLRHLDSHKIGTRLLFGGSLPKQPYFKNVKHRVAADLVNTEIILQGTFWLGIYPGITEEMLDFVADRLIAFCRGKG